MFNIMLTVKAWPRPRP